MHHEIWRHRSSRERSDWLVNCFCHLHLSESQSGNAAENTNDEGVD